MKSSDTPRMHMGACLSAAVAVLAVAVLAFRLNPGLWVQLGIGWKLLLAGDPAPLRVWLLEFGAWAPLVSGLLQIFSSLIPFLPGFVLAIANAMLYGFLWGAVLTFVTALIAAGVCFGLARMIGRPGVERLVSRRALARVDAFMERKGMMAVFLGRLIPFINPDVLSYAAGATRMGWTRFLLAMATGALPATVFYSLVGGMAVESTLRVLGIVMAVAILPLVVLTLFRGRILRKVG